jgi:hypothetical protein
MPTFSVHILTIGLWFAQAGYRSVATNAAAGLARTHDVLSKCVQEYGCFDMLGAFEAIAGPQVRPALCFILIFTLNTRVQVINVITMLHVSFASLFTARGRAGEGGGDSGEQGD